MNDLLMDPRRLELLLELSRLGSMREVGEALHITTSTVSQQIAALAREAAPAGTVRVAAFASAVRQLLLPVARILAGQHPDVQLHIHEHEPAEALGLLAANVATRWMSSAGTGTTTGSSTRATPPTRR